MEYYRCLFYPGGAHLCNRVGHARLKSLWKVKTLQMYQDKLCMVAVQQTLLSRMHQIMSTDTVVIIFTSNDCEF